MQFVLTLHSHLPWVLNHGRWPHGSDWLCEATLDTYLPLLQTLRGLVHDGVPAPITLGITPVLANQLANPLFAEEMEAFFQQRLEACEEAPASLAETGDEHLTSLVRFWRDRFLRFMVLQSFNEARHKLLQVSRLVQPKMRNGTKVSREIMSEPSCCITTSLHFQPVKLK